MTTMLTIDWAMRAICMASSTRPSEGTAKRARYEGSGATGATTDRLLKGCVLDVGSVPQIGRRRRRLFEPVPEDQAERPQSGSTTIGVLPLYAAWASADWLCGCAAVEPEEPLAVPPGFGVLTPMSASACSALAWVRFVSSGSKLVPENIPPESVDSPEPPYRSEERRVG